MTDIGVPVSGVPSSDGDRARQDSSVSIDPICPLSAIRPNVRETQLICVNLCTYDRPRMLETCLRSIAGQTVPEGWSYRVVVVENCESPKSSALVQKVAEETGLSLDYVLEPERGISLVRNRALAVSLERGADWIAFIDDDETAEPGWLVAYCRAASVYGAEIMRGTIVLDYPPGAPDWLPRRNKAVAATGMPNPPVSTGNMMISARLVSPSGMGLPGMGLRFDPKMRFSGGEDRDLCRKAVRRGAKAISVRESVVREKVMENRLTAFWQLRRVYASSVNYAEIRAGERPWVTNFPYCLTKALLKAGKGTGLLLAALPVALFSWRRFLSRAFHALECLAAAAGFLGYFAGHRPQPYRVTDGH